LLMPAPSASGKPSIWYADVAAPQTKSRGNDGGLFMVLRENFARVKGSAAILGKGCEAIINSVKVDRDERQPERNDHDRGQQHGIFRGTTEGVATRAS